MKEHLNTLSITAEDSSSLSFRKIMADKKTMDIIKLRLIIISRMAISDAHYSQCDHPTLDLLGY